MQECIKISLMSKKTKKILISLSTAVVLVGILVTLAFTVFSLKTVKVDWRTTHSSISLSDQELIDGAQFSFGSSVFFHGKKGYEERIENLSPYIDVVNIETVFPSTFVLHVAQRQEVYAFENGEQTLICDQNLRVLKIEEDYSSTQDNAMLVLGVEIEEKAYQPGQYLAVENFIDIYSSLFECNRTLGQQQSLIKSIEFLQEYDQNIATEQTTAILNLFGGQTVQIKNATYGLRYKLDMFLQVFSNLYSLIGQEIASGGVWTQELLDGCTIAVNNYYNYTEHNESECYFNIVP